MYLEYDTPVWSLVMIWSTPSSRYVQVVVRSALAGGMGYALLPVLLAAMTGNMEDEDVEEEGEEDVVGDQEHRSASRALSAWLAPVTSTPPFRDTGPCCGHPSCLLPSSGFYLVHLALTLTQPSRTQWQFHSDRKGTRGKSGRYDTEAPPGAGLERPS